MLRMGGVFILCDKKTQEQSPSVHTITHMLDLLDNPDYSYIYTIHETQTHKITNIHTNHAHVGSVVQC